MWESIGQSIATLVTGFVGGVFGSFVATPVGQFYDLRRRIRSRMHHFDNIAPMDGSDLQNARETLRALSTDLLALVETAPTVAKMLSWLGYDAELAARSQLGFSNSLAVRDGSKAKFRDQVERGLKLPLSYPT